jgi:hypothetical protein
MNNLEFLSYQPTPSEKQLGIATIRIERKYIFRFKIQQNPKGEGYFSNAPSVKIGDSYYPSFQLDSSYEADEIKKFVLSNVKQALQSSQPSAFTPTTLQFSPAPAQNEFNFDQPPF